MNGNTTNKVRTLLRVLILYSGLTLIMTYPLVLNLRTHVPGGGDVWQNIWLLWHTKFALFDPVESLYYTNYLFYPTGTPLIPMSLYNQLLSVPLQYVFSLSLTYNILFLSSFVLAGTTSFYLIKYFTNNNYAAFLGGLVYAFAPNTLAHALGHMEAITTGWIPLYVLFLFKLMEEKNGIKEETKSAFLASLGLILVAASDLVYMMFTIIFTGFFIVYWIFKKKSLIFLKSRKFIIFYVFFLIGILPFTLPLIQVALSGQNFLKPQIGESVIYSADIVGFFIPAAYHSFFGSYTAPYVNQFTGNPAENTTFLGYTVIILIIYAFIKLKEQNINFWKTSFIFTFLLSLGPVLHIMGKYLFNGIPVPMPYSILYFTIPFLQNARTIVRIDVLVMLSAAILVGYAISHIIVSLNDNKKKITIIAFSLIILFEFMVIPFPLSKIDEPEFYTNLSKDKTENITLVEVPGLWNYEYGIKTMYYQTIHGKKITSGALARVPPYVYRFAQTTPAILELNFDQGKLIKDIIIQNEIERAQAVQDTLEHYDIKYIILSVDYLPENQLKNATSILKEIGAKKTIQTEHQIVYEISSIRQTSYAKIEKGWYDLGIWNDFPVRWMENDATLLLYSNKSRTGNISFEALSFYRPRTLEIYSNNYLVGQVRFSHVDFNMTKVPIILKEGNNLIRFHVPEGCEKPGDKLMLKNKDERCLSLAIRNVTIT